MSISTEEEGGGRRGGRRKSTSGSLNLVPYIDLLTCMVAFLLITAVWTQLARLPVRQKGQATDYPHEVVHQTKIVVVVHEDGFALVVDRVPEQPVPMRDGALNYGALEGELKTVKQRFPDATDVEVASADGIAFDALVRTMDAVLSAGFPDVSLSEAERR